MRQFERPQVKNETEAISTRELEESSADIPNSFEPEQQLENTAVAAAHKAIGKKVLALQGDKRS